VLTLEAAAEDVTSLLVEEAIRYGVVGVSWIEEETETGNKHQVNVE
jgi:hypothetical protein